MSNRTRFGLSVGRGLMIAALAMLVPLTGCKDQEVAKGLETGKKGAVAGASFQEYGKSIAAVEVLTPIPTIAQSPADFDGKEVVVRGVIASVCPSAGCFMTLGEGAAQLFVDMNPNGFHVPPGKNGGSVAYAAGTIQVSGNEPTLVATGVRILEK
jgi:hypothetical protein